ncbi:MAG: cytochrome o ubiquinol oxidase subunit III [Candidatus Pacebacteria bacterium]|nr:cytochrome o ubiquinol oxidase subunit III [Candidatus Paceibacterota bacterium]
MTHPSTHSGQADKVTFGFWVYLMSDCVLFAGLFATYAVLSGATFGAPGIGDIVSLPYVAGETLLLLTSSFTIGLALLAAQANKKRLVLVALAATLALGLGFLAMEVYEFAHLIGAGHGPDKSAFLSAFFTLLGTHGLHVALGLVWMLVVMAHVYMRGLAAGTRTKLMCLGLFWHFLDIIWIFIFTFVYLFGSL